MVLEEETPMRSDLLVSLRLSFGGCFLWKLRGGFKVSRDCLSLSRAKCVMLRKTVQMLKPGPPHRPNLNCVKICFKIDQSPGSGRQPWGNAGKMGSVTDNFKAEMRVAFSDSIIPAY